MPEEKQAKLDFMMRTIPTDGTTAYVGDGVSDIEQLKMADVGVVMGTRGSRYSADAAPHPLNSGSRACPLPHRHQPS